jgi:hypothetical protein
MHGGGAQSGAPPGNTNALTHGLHTRERREERQQLQELMRESHRLIKAVE